MEPDEGMQEDPTKPQKPQRNIAANVEALRARKASEADIEAYLRSEGFSPDSAAAPSAADAEALLRETGILGGQQAAPKPPPTVRPDVSSALARNRKGASGDFQAITNNPGKTAKVAGGMVGSHLLNTAQVIPGVEALEAFGGSKLMGVPYKDALQSLRQNIEENVGPMAGLEKMAAGASLLGPMKFLTPTQTGAVLGGADRLLQADPDKSIERRLFETGAGAAGGALTGNLLEKGGSLARALGGETPKANMLMRQAERAKVASKMYGAGMAEGHANQVTPAIQQYLAEPQIAQRVAELQKLSEFAGVPAESPEMLDALSKVFSDEAHAISKGLSVADPSKPNTGRFRLRDVRGQKQGLLDAMTAPTVNAAGQPVPGTAYMPSYPAAEAEYAKHSADLQALLKGVDVNQTVSRGRPTAAQMAKEKTTGLLKTPEGVQAFGASAPASQVQAAREGILGDVKNAFGRGGFLYKEGRQALRHGTGLLRDLDPNSPELQRIYQSLGLLNSQVANK